MPRIHGPLFCLNAVGTFSHILQFSQRPPYGVHASPKRATIPGKSRSQLARRSFMGALAQAWPQFLPEWHGSWDQLARNARSTPYHAYLANNFARFLLNLFPIATNEAASGAAAPNMSTTFEAGPHRLSSRQVWATGQKPVWAVHIATPPSFTTIQANNVQSWHAFFPRLASWRHYLKVAPGTYRLYAACVDQFGRLGPSKNAAGLAVTD
jgi:hypothetical protein